MNDVRLSSICWSCAENVTADRFVYFIFKLFFFFTCVFQLNSQGRVTRLSVEKISFVLERELTCVSLWQEWDREATGGSKGDN